MNNVFQLQNSDDLDRLAQRAIAATQSYVTNHQRSEKNHPAIRAAISQFGAALSEGRKLHASDELFGKWIAQHGLDQTKPFDDRQERTSAQALARVVSDEKISSDHFSGCHYTRPNDIMIWVRKQPWYVPPSKKSTKNPTKSTKRPGKSKTAKSKKGAATREHVLYQSAKLKTLTREQVDPEFTGTAIEFIDKYGHVQVETAKDRATARFNAWARNLSGVVKAAKNMPDWPEVDQNWLRAPRPADVAKLTESVDYLRAKLAEAEALLLRAQQAVLTPSAAPQQQQNGAAVSC